MLTALSAKNKVEFIDGSISKPAMTHALFSMWKRCNNMVVSWLVHSVSTSIRQIILWMDNVVDIWKDLKARYSFWEFLIYSKNLLQLNKVTLVLLIISLNWGLFRMSLRITDQNLFALVPQNALVMF